MRGWYKNSPASPFMGGAAGPSYVFLYGMMTACFIVLMLFRGSFFHLWTLGAGNRMMNNMVHK